MESQPNQQNNSCRSVKVSLAARKWIIHYKVVYSPPLSFPKSICHISLQKPFSFPLILSMSLIINSFCLHCSSLQSLVWVSQQENPAKGNVPCHNLNYSLHGRRLHLLQESLFCLKRNSLRVIGSQRCTAKKTTADNMKKNPFQRQDGRSMSENTD